MAHKSPILDQHHQASAFTRQYGPDDIEIEVVETFGLMELEYGAVRKGAALLDQPQRGTLEITGDDRHSFLNNMVTNRVSEMKPGDVVRALWLNRKGRIVGELRLAELGDRINVDIDAHALEAVRASLDAYVITEDVAIRDISNHVHRLALHGPRSIAALSNACDGSPPDGIAQGRSITVSIRGHAVIVERNDLTGALGLELTMPTESALSVYNALAPKRVDHGDTDDPHVRPTVEHDPYAGAAVRPTGWLAVNTARIEAGHPMQFLDYATETLPAECGETFLHTFVDFKKGCYLGQEVVARMFSLGAPKQVLVGLRPAGDPPRDADGHALQALGGANVYLEEDDSAPIGGVTSSTISPMLGGLPVAFAMMRTKHATEGAEVMVTAEGVPMRCIVHRDLKFYSLSPGPASGVSGASPADRT